MERLLDAGRHIYVDKPLATCYADDDGRCRVIDLAQVVRYGDGITVTRRGDWTPVARQRGIEQICAAFLDAVRCGSLLSAEDALATHAICEQIVTNAHG